MLFFSSKGNGPTTTIVMMTTMIFIKPGLKPFGPQFLGLFI
jgi:hypothetical protein